MFFSKFENMVAGRYLRAKRKEGFISVITSFAFIGIALGVATLIIVTSVMNGFKEELLGRILGINGHISIAAVRNAPFDNYSDAVKMLEERIPGVDVAIPMVEKQLLATAGNTAEGVMVRGVRGIDLQKKQVLRDGFKDFDLKLFEAGKETHDAQAPDGRLVQIKATQVNRIAISSEPEWLLVLKIHRDGTFSVEYNGPGNLVWRCCGKTQKNGQRPISLSKLRELQEQVPESERLARIL